MHQLLLSFGDSNERQQAEFTAAPQQAPEQADPVPVAAAISQVVAKVEQEPPPKPAPIPRERASTLISAMEKEASSTTSNKTNPLAGPSGSFFGINASGQKFVYVIDKSGSMKGRRYERATGELMASVERLNDSQYFYVMMFSSDMAFDVRPIRWNSKTRCGNGSQ